MLSFETNDGQCLMRVTVCVISGFLIWATSDAGVQGARRQSLEEKLGTVTDYMPKATAPLDQLIEVARRFKIPMGIEWAEREGTAEPEKMPFSRKRTVRELIEHIASVSPEHCVEVDDGLVRVYSPTKAAHPFNFLNIRLKNYFVKHGDLFAAEDQLRWAIRFTLEPEEYLNGYNGGYGHGANDIFEIPKFTLSVSDVTIREVLNRLALAQGNALWVTTIKKDELQGGEPSWRRNGADGGDLPVTSSWHFLPLGEITELAKHQVAVDVLISGMLDQRMSTIPVMLEHRLAGDSGGSIGGGSSEGNSFVYGASIEKIGKDFVTLSVHLKVLFRGELEFNFEDKLQVNKGRVTEVRPEPRILIRAYFERRERDLQGRRLRAHSRRPTITAGTPRPILECFATVGWRSAEIITG